jgi:hypothetical protein
MKAASRHGGSVSARRARAAAGQGAADRLPRQSAPSNPFSGRNTRIRDLIATVLESRVAKKIIEGVQDHVWRTDRRARCFSISLQPGDKVSPTAERSRHRASVLQEGQKGGNIRASLVVIRAIPVKTAQ